MAESKDESISDSTSATMEAVDAIDEEAREGKDDKGEVVGVSVEEATCVLIIVSDIVTLCCARAVLDAMGEGEAKTESRALDVVVIGVVAIDVQDEVNDEVDTLSRLVDGDCPVVRGVWVM